MEREEDKQNSPCGKAEAESEMYKEEWDVLEGEVRDVNEGGMESFDSSDSREKAIAILGDRWWSKQTKQDRDKICRRLLCEVWKQPDEHLKVGGVTHRSRNGAPSLKGCVVNGHITKANNKGVRFSPHRI